MCWRNVVSSWLGWNSHSSQTAWLWRWRQYDPFTCWNPLIQLYSITSQKIVPSATPLWETEISHTWFFCRYGRVNYVLAKRLDLLMEVQRLQDSLDVAGDVAYTCETAGHFFLYQILARWERFLSRVRPATGKVCVVLCCLANTIDMRLLILFLFMQSYKVWSVHAHACVHMCAHTHTLTCVKLCINAYQVNSCRLGIVWMVTLYVVS